MSGRNPRLNPLESRKQLLLAESELNRAQLVGEWQTLSGEAHALADQAKTITAIAAALATLVVACGPKKPVPAAEKPSWWQTLLKVVSVFKG